MSVFPRLDQDLTCWVMRIMLDARSNHSGVLHELHQFPAMGVGSGTCHQDRTQAESLKMIAYVERGAAHDRAIGKDICQGFAKQNYFFHGYIAMVSGHVLLRGVMMTARFIK